ncbi:MAG: tetratricopeptide repeat protein [Rhizobacter sp.]|nr:tetratricopeptide repeat protein [Ferruginibacter sp.]
MKKKTALCLIFCIIGISTLQAQNKALDSLQSLLKRSTNDTARIGLYTEMSYSADDTGAVLYSDTAISLINLLLPPSNNKRKTELHRYQSNAFYYRSVYFANTESYDTALYYLNKAMEQALLAKDRLQEARVLNDLGVCFFRKNDVVKSVDYLTKSLVIREELNDDEQLHNAYNNVAFIYKETGLIDQSLELNFKALALGERRKNAEDIALSFNNIGQLYHKYLMDRDKALEYYKKGLAISEREGDKKATSLVKNNIGALSAETGKYAEAIRWYLESLQLRREINYKFGIINTLSSLGYNYIKTGNYDSARAALAEALQMNTILHNKVLQTSIHRNYAELYKAIDKTDSALYHAKLSHSINLEFGNPLNISGSAIMLSGLYEKNGNYSEALDFYKLHKKMQDSISNDDLKKEGIKSNIEYEYLKKKTESDKIHGEQLAKKNLYTWLLLVLFIASVLIGYGLYKRYRLKQQLKEVEIRNKIAADLHDDVGSTLSSIRMYSDIVKQQPNQTGTSIQLLDKISSNSKETIENMSDIVWMIKPGNDEFANIEDRMLNFANELCAPRNINFEMHKNDLLSGVKIPMELRRDIYLIFKEAVNNAVKYSNCHFIRSSIQLDKTLLKMQVSDDGNGFDMARVKKGNGISNMHKRAVAHNGNCSIQSKEGEGTEITVVFSI